MGSSHSSRPIGAAPFPTSSAVASGSSSPASRDRCSRGNGVDRLLGVQARRRRVSGEESQVTTYRVAEGSDPKNGVTLVSSGTYTRSGTRQQADQSLEMTATGERHGEHRISGDGAVISAQGNDRGDMTITYRPSVRRFPSSSPAATRSRQRHTDPAPAAPVSRVQASLLRHSDPAGIRRMALRRVAPACLVSEPLAEGDGLHGDAASEPLRREALVSSGAARLHRPGDGGGGDHRRRRPFLDS